MADQHLISLQPGTVIAGRYEVVKCLGAGSMGLVYACRHRELSGHLVAIKVLFPEVAQDSVASARFRNEIVASYGVSHPNVVRAYEYFRDGDLVAYTMEYIGGGDLADKLGRGGPKLSIPEIVRFLSQIGSGVQSIHDAGIVHRDLKPENILLTEGKDVKITDFGIARTGHGPKLTEHGGVVGTIDYVSPEYLEKGQVDSRSDIYAIGVLGFEMITGESPFRGDSVIATMTMRLRTDPKLPSSLRPECPAELDAVIMKAMERNPEKRYQRAIDIYYDLEPLMREYSGKFRVVAPPTRGASPQSSDRELTDSRTNIPQQNFGGIVGSQNNNPSMRSSGPIREQAAPANDTEVNFYATRDRTVQPGPGRNRYPSMEQIGRQDPAIWSGGGRHEDTQADTITDPFHPNSGKIDSVFDGVAATQTNMRVPSYFDSGSSKVQIGGGGIDNRRIRAISESMAYQNVRPLWIDLITVIVAVLIGLGVGLAVLKMLKPEVFSLNSKKNLRALDVD